MVLPEEQSRYYRASGTWGCASQRIPPLPSLEGVIIQEVHPMFLLRREEGQGLAEYALILALIAVLAIAAVTFLGSNINSILSNVGNSI